MDLDSSTFRIVPRPQDCDSLLRGAQKNDPQLCRDLITLLNVPPSYGNAIGQTALHVAVLWGHIEAAEVRTFDKIKVCGRGIVIIIIIVISLSEKSTMRSLYYDQSQAATFGRKH